jgi:subtilase family serine protease
MRSSIVILALVALGCVGMALGGRVSFHGAVPTGWQRLQRVAPTHNIHLTFALKQQNVDKLEEVFWAVSDPTSSEYGRHLSVNDVQSIVAPAPDTIAAVQTWLKSHGVAAKQEASSDYLSARVEASLAEEMLDCEFYYFSHSQVGASLRIIRADGNYSLPVEGSFLFENKKVPQLFLACTLVCHVSGA